MSIYISKQLREQIRASDRQRCCYCLTSEVNSGIPMTFDHILPVSKGGETNFENLCLACRSCNEFKSDTTEVQDPVTDEIVPLYNPRTQRWIEHFYWSEDATKIEEQTAIARVTIIALRMNNAVIRAARLRWAIALWHPPSDML
ncbi:HNH endonuclease [Desertifilum sp. FACHB-1129]|uniref:HNH endonuclease n=2 Tax=Desertifilum tharense IPPAS B-1220 TaxID=1781255 RepID=A0A1E5QP87_9CYAN|nr:HNH endonuclease [Desertifilum tharense]MBD2312894.1 HNH endonuclease [Desertifilum sp. FACHB-1129]MBD2323770.1 HNH endonuclease [Desertifilum sp. FACHB-866]MBD2333615.1 HNH endonuclease [Desertifilum sp. FACHB-868]MDA0210696.1 HNH endonuclease [Cyanobacteria bacterium FC1]OEJ76407.1 HNH endonuclease [Desertifilum tharense IPPAS B-1220]